METKYFGIFCKVFKKTPLVQFTTGLGFLCVSSFATAEQPQVTSPEIVEKEITLEDSAQPKSTQAEIVAQVNTSESPGHADQLDCESQKLDAKHIAVRKGCEKLTLARSTIQNNHIDAQVDGAGNATRISVGGKDNRVITRQSGTGNSITIIQSGSGSNIAITQQKNGEEGAGSESVNEIHLELEKPDELIHP